MKQRTDNTFARQSADGYINLRVCDTNGVWHGFKVGIPLYSNRAVDRVLLADPEILANLPPERISMSLHIVQDDIEPSFESESEAPAKAAPKKKAVA